MLIGFTLNREVTLAGCRGVLFCVHRNTSQIATVEIQTRIFLRHTLDRIHFLLVESVQPLYNTHRYS
jgi:hypothetical protein